MTRYWFRPKRYGYGATPTTWEGWALVLVFAVFMGGSIVVLERFAGSSNPVGLFVWAAVVGTGIWWLVHVSRDRTDGEWRWRWGSRD